MEPLDLHKGARTDEVFYLQQGEPVPKSWGWRWLIRRTSWSNIFLADGTPARWTNWNVFWGGQFYHGNAKCDATRCFAYWAGQLGGTMDRSKYVMTATPKEMLAFRWRSKGSDKTPVWSNMGNS
ncbi:MAG: hypothetical protein Q7U76_13150 [Nitrospirota bacterium]|nr:hypothetical protein [Nitrospirota bacterium]